MKSITVFTPTFNRAYCLSRCYESLKRQSNKDFEWLIVDDGSNDNTKELVNKWQNETNDFNINYIYKVNGGMHTAYNIAYEFINTELCMNVDSDDYLIDDAIDVILKFWNNNKRSDIGGIYALDCYQNGTIIGSPFPDDLSEFQGWGYKEIHYFVNGKKKIHKNRGDKKFIGVTKIIQQYPPIPVFEDEKYHSLYYKQHLIEKDFAVLILNRPVCVVEYLNDGSSKNMYFQYVRNPKGFCNERRYVMKNAPTFKLKMEASIHYVAESIIAKDINFIANSTNILTVCISIPFGILLYLLIRSKTRK